MTKGEQTKERILNTVLAFIKQGVDYDKLTMTEIAFASQIGKSTVYEYFKTKEELIFKTYQYLLDQYERMLSEPLSATCFKSQFYEQIKRIFDVMMDAKVIMETLILGKETTFFSKKEQLQIQIQSIQSKMEKRFIDIFVLGNKEDVIQNKNPHPHDAHVIQAIINGLMMQYVNKEIQVNEQELFDIMYTYIVRLLNA